MEDYGADGPGSAWKLWPRPILSVLHPMERRMSSEMDHLLPRYLNAPEINSGWKSHEQCQTPNPNSLGEEVEKEHLHYIEITFLKSLIIIFPLVIIIALVTGFFASKSITLQDGGPQKDPSIAGRVKNILSENPLIGLFS